MDVSSGVDTTEIKKGSRVRVLNTLSSEMEKIGFDALAIEPMAELIGTEQSVYAVWTDETSGTTFATIDLCVEIPIQCLELVKP